MEYTANILAITIDDWQEAGLTYDQFKNDRRRGFLQTINRASFGNQVLIKYESLRDKRKRAIQERFGNPYEAVNAFSLARQVVTDQEAVNFFHSYELPNGRSLPPEKIREYCANASVLNAVAQVISKRRARRSAVGASMSRVWEGLASQVNSLPLDEFPHTLPVNPRRLRERHEQYSHDGYASLVHKGFCNQNTRKVSRDLERLFLALYSMKTRPFSATVRDLYLQFLAGAIDVVDTETGELFEPSAFFSASGEPVGVSEATAWRYINKPSNRVLVDKRRVASIDFNTTRMGHNHRHKPNYTLSKVSFDDRTLPRKMHDGRWAQAYYAYEPLSGCFVGASYSLTKDHALIFDCFRDMYRNLSAYNMPWPAEAEVERHLMSSIKPTLEALFAYTRWCNPENSREKRAEHGIRSKKYGTEKLHQENIGRWSNKHDAYQTNPDEDRRFTFEELVADDRYSIQRHNHGPHPSFPGKTRWEVLVENLNPSLVELKPHMAARYLGQFTETSIRNNDHVRVQYKDYGIGGLEVLDKLQPNNYKVTAYYLDEQGPDITRVYLYQGETYMGEALVYETYNEAMVERTPRDEEIRVEQAKRQAKARKIIKDGVASIPKVAVSYPAQIIDIPIEDIIHHSPPEDEEPDYMAGYDPEEWRRRAFESL